MVKIAGTPTDKEMKQESQRLEIFAAHEKVIPAALELKFAELTQDFKKLRPLLKPAEPFLDTPKTGIPHIAGNTIFINILLNKNLNSFDKFCLLYELISDKGYSPYIDILFSLPTLDFLCLDPEPGSLLRPLYTQALCIYRTPLSPKSEARVWTTLTSDHPRGLLNILTARDLSPLEIFAKIEQYAQGLDRQDLRTFIKTYKYFLSCTPELKGTLSCKALRNIFKIDENQGKNFYLLIAKQNPTNEYLLAFLATWLKICKSPDNILFAETAYFSLCSQVDFPYTGQNDKTIWKALIRHDHKTAFNLFRHILFHTPGIETKILDFIHIWLNLLNKEEDLRLAAQNIEETISGTDLSNNMFYIRMWVEKRSYELALTKTSPLLDQGFFSCWGTKNNQVLAEEYEVVEVSEETDSDLESKTELPGHRK